MRLPFVLIWDRAYTGFSVQKWSYRGVSSWWHGTAYLWHLKIVW
jgi:hypothetical protein